MNREILCIVLLSSILLVKGQKKDSLKNTQLEEVVITGQYTQQAINKSIYKVEVIDEAQIKNMAVTNAAEVLNQNLNILIEPNRSNGDSSAGILGLSGEYTKVLIDNIPVVSDKGMGNLVDLSKINVNNIERIEIVKGAMGVEYGNNAVAGVINIITKKKYSKKVNALISLQEETVGKDYDWFKKGNGRHIQSLNLGYQISDSWSFVADINHNDFQGYKGIYKGYKYFNASNDNLRGYEWLPKEQLNANATLRYSKNKTNFFYKANFLSEEVNYYNPIITDYPLGQGLRTYVADDKDYFTTRWIHQFNIQTQLGSRINYQGDFSYQSQERKFQNIQYDVPNRSVLEKEDKETYYKSTVFYSRGMFSNFLDSDKYNFQLGYELDHTKGYADSSTFESNNNNKSINRTIFNYANFLSAELQFTDRFSVRPGVRLALSDKFDSQYNYSVTGKYSLSKNSDLRAIFGSANRFPVYEELYTYVVDSNHDIRGNENLKPETGYSTGLFWDYKKTSPNLWTFGANLSGMYLLVNDRIESVIVSTSPLKYTYLNVDNYKSLLFSGSFSLKKNNFYVGAGLSLLGISQSLNTGTQTSPNDFNYNLEVNLSANYTLPRTKTLFALFYKYTGKNKKYSYQSESTNSQSEGKYVLGTIDDFQMLNFTITQPFFKNHFDLSVGVKNLFNVTTINNTTIASGGHSGVSTEQNLFYGRSYFARVTYNF